MALKNAALDIANELTGQTIGGQTLTIGTNLFATPEYPQNWAISVACVNNGGDVPIPYLSTTQTAIMKPIVQVITRAPPGQDAFEAGQTLALALVAALQQRTGYGTPTTITTKARESFPFFAVDQETQQQFWSSNFEVWYEGTVSSFT